MYKRQVLTLVDNDNELLKSGMNATVDIMIEGKDNALVVPTRAVKPASEAVQLASIFGISPEELRKAHSRHFIFVKGEHGVEARPVRVGISNWSEFEIVDGIKEGEEVLVFLSSRALEQSKEFLERRSRMAIPGLRKR